MRTTISLRDDLYEAVRKQAFEERRTLGEVVTDLIESGLSLQAQPRTLGAFVGRIVIPESFDDDLDDLETLLSDSVEP